MDIQQYYYTSYRNKKTGSSGFQIKALSPHIPLQIQQTIISMISYRIPPTLNVFATETHPIALRYQYIDEDTCVVICCQSNGNDDNQRPGNFFAHALIMNKEQLISVPAIFLWKSPLWQHADPVERPQIESLPELSELMIEPTFDVDAIWEFIADKHRRFLLHQLLCAVIHSHKTQQHIVILDTIENVVLWIASISCLLPPDYRPLLTFSTYHHQPHQNNYLITGTSTDAYAAFQPEMQQHCFILNAEEDKTSTVEPSTYAELATSITTAEEYERILLPVFAKSMQRFPSPEVIDEQLDQIATYSALLSGTYTKNDLDLTMQQAIAIALSTLETESRLNNDDKTELYQLEQSIRQMLKKSNTAAISSIYQRIHNLFEKHALDQERIVTEELATCTQHILSDQYTAQKTIFQLLAPFATHDSILHAIHNPTYLRWVNTILVSHSAAQQGQFWQTIGASLQPGNASRQLLLISLQKAAELIEQHEFTECDLLIKGLAQLLQEHPMEWWQTILDIYQDTNSNLPLGTLNRLYYQQVASLPETERRQYRQLVQTINDDIFIYEIQQDLHQAPEQQRNSVLIQSLMNASEQIAENKRAKLVLSTMIQIVQEFPTIQERRIYAQQLLHDPALQTLPTDIRNNLHYLVISTLGIPQLAAEGVPFYDACLNQTELPDEMPDIISSLKAIKAGKIEKTQAQAFQTRLTELSDEEFTETLTHCLPAFFEHATTAISHQGLLYAFISTQTQMGQRNKFFWSAYKKICLKLSQQPETQDKLIGVLDFWFRVRPEYLPNEHVLPQFFQYAPLTEIYQAFERAGAAIHQQAIQRNWYASLSLTKYRKKTHPSTSGITNRLMKFMRPNKKKPDLEKTTQELGQIFEKPTLLESHKNDLLRIYNQSNHDHFWDTYWDCFLMTFLVDKNGYASKLGSFWFDCAFLLFQGEDASLAQEFFLGLPSMLSSMQTIRDGSPNPLFISFATTDAIPAVLVNGTERGRDNRQNHSNKKKPSDARKGKA